MPLSKSCNKLPCVKFITLNLLLISRNCSTQQIDICSIIIKLYKSQHCQPEQNSTNTKESCLSFENLIKTNAQVYFDNELLKNKAKHP